jgi:hypothetical protein
MFLLYHSEGCNICEMVLHECYINDLHTTTCSGMLGHHIYVVRHFDNYFICKKDCTGMVGFSSLQKCTAALRMLVYGAPGDSQDDYIRMAESKAMECMSRFCWAVVSVLLIENTQ